MNYQHAYHVGNVADVFKHMVLVQLLQNLRKKPSAFSYIETHAGKAIYDLQDTPAQKTVEYKQGIEALWQKNALKEPAILDYLQIIQTENPDNTLKFYPGSGLITKHLLREEDEAVLCEYHPVVCQQLKQYFQHNKQVHVHLRNGYEAMPALIPPQTKRGMILIDPPYEINDEYQQLVTVLQKSLQRWPNGIYAIWFPIKQYNLILNFYHAVKNATSVPILTAEFWTTFYKEDVLNGSGLAIINPPWQFDLLLQSCLPALLDALNFPQGKTQVTWL